MNRQTTAGGCEEMRNWVNGDNDSSDGDGKEQLNADYDVYLTNEGPPQLRALLHRRVQPAAANFHVSFPGTHRFTLNC